MSIEVEEVDGEGHDDPDQSNIHSQDETSKDTQIQKETNRSLTDK